MPRFTADGQVCEIGVQRRLYSPEIVRVNAEFPRNEVQAVLDELVPAEERGEPVKSPADGLVTGDGATQSASMDFENVLVEIDGAITEISKKKTIATQVVTIIKFKKRPCPE